LLLFVQNIEIIAEPPEFFPDEIVHANVILPRLLPPQIEPPYNTRLPPVYSPYHECHGSIGIFAFIRGSTLLCRPGAVLPTPGPRLPPVWKAGSATLLYFPETVIF
jgi:hypothetical protein